MDIFDGNIQYWSGTLTPRTLKLCRCQIPRVPLLRGYAADQTSYAATKKDCLPVVDVFVASSVGANLTPDPSSASEHNVAKPSRNGLPVLSLT